MAVLPRAPDVKFSVESGKEGFRHPFENSHGTISLHVGVSPNGTEPSAWSADSAKQKMEVRDFPDRGYCVTVLGQAHRPAGNEFFFSTQNCIGEFFDLRAGDGAFSGQIIPRCRFADVSVGVNIEGVPGYKVLIDYSPWPGAFTEEQFFAEGPEQSEISIDSYLQILRGKGSRFIEEAAYFLRMSEAEKSGLPEWVDGNDPGSILDRCFKGRKHTGVIGAGILANTEDGVRLVEILKGHGSLSNADGCLQGRSGGFVAHVRAIWKVVGAKMPDKKLIEKGSLIACAARGVKDPLIRGGERIELVGNQGECIIPRNGFVMGCILPENEWFGQSPTLIVPVV